MPTPRSRSVLVVVRRFVAVAGIAIMVAAVGAVLAAPAAAAPRAADVALERIVPAGSCGTLASMLLAEDDTATSRSSVSTGWVVAGSRYRGSAAEAAAAFGGDLIATDDSEAWIAKVLPSGETVGLQLRRSAGSTPDWTAGDQLRRVECP